MHANSARGTYITLLIGWLKSPHPFISKTSFYSIGIQSAWASGELFNLRIYVQVLTSITRLFLLGSGHSLSFFSGREESILGNIDDKSSTAFTSVQYVSGLVGYMYTLLKLLRPFSFKPGLWHLCYFSLRECFGKYAIIALNLPGYRKLLETRDIVWCQCMLIWGPHAVTFNENKLFLEWKHCWQTPMHLSNYGRAL